MMLSEPREVKLKDFFVSFNKADRRWAEWIAWQLEAAGYTVIFQNWDFAPGGNFVLNMHQAVENSERTIAVLSTDFLQSAFTQPEWAAALAKDPTGRHQKLVPVRVRECEPDGLLGQINYLDFVSIDEAAARTRLLNAAGKIRGLAARQVLPRGREPL
jgi:hypothetical protein